MATSSIAVESDRTDATDYARLRADALSLLGRLAGTQWTDFNAHDPGITILEQLCYAITDLGYRCGHPMADLLAASGDTGLAGPAEALSSDPVTLADLRHLALDAAGADRASVTPLPATSLCFHEASHEIRPWPDPADITATPLQLRGLHNMALRFDDADDVSTDAALEALSRRLHASRPLGNDFEFRRLLPFSVSLSAQVEVAATDDPVTLLADIVERIDDRLAPPARFQQPIASAPDVRFEGPLLRRGVVVEMPESPATVFASDLIHAITDLPQVRAVSAIDVPSAFPLTIPPDRVAVLDERSTEIVLWRAGARVRADQAAAFARVRERRRARRAAVIDVAVPELPRGRDRRLARHRSVQRQMPAAYGIGVYGLPGAASPRRQAQALQLQAYLLIFDQLLAHQFGQLSQAHRLLSPDVGGLQSYFPQPVDDPVLPLDRLLRPAGAATEDPDAADVARRRRFVAHLLARQGEGDGGDPPLHDGTGPDADERQALLRRQRLLAALPRLHAARGTGCNLLTGVPSPLAERIALKYGLALDSFELIEHILLRPVREDANQVGGDDSLAVPLLDSVDGPDLWSQRVSFVFRVPQGLAPDSQAFLELHRFTWQAVRAETPAHLGCQLHWLDDGGADLSFTAFQAAWRSFLDLLRAYRWPAPAAPAADLQLAHLRLRDARDRIIEALGLARTYPLRDLPWPHSLVVPAGSPARVVLAYSQPGVVYELRRDDETQSTVLDRKTGVGGELVLDTPPVTVNITCRVLAIKFPLDEPSASPLDVRQAWLLGEVQIEEGIDPNLDIELIGGPDLPLLDSRIDRPKPTDARLARFGAAVQVLVRLSQEGVAYRLRDKAQPDADLSDAVTGTGSDIALTLARATEDIDLLVHGSRHVGGPDHPELREALLSTVLHLRVRADPGVPATLEADIVGYNGHARLRLAGSQPGVQYQAWSRPVRDSEFWFGVPASAEIISLPGEIRPVDILRPPRRTVWQDLGGFQPHGDVATGDGSSVAVVLTDARHDLLVLVRARKQHQPLDLSTGGGEQVASAVQLDQALALLVRPDPNAALRLLAPVGGNGDNGPWLLQGGQPGVYYRLLHAAFAAGPPAYFHQRDEANVQFNKGIGAPGVGGLGVELDLALARDRIGPADVARAAPPDPLLEADPVPRGSTIEVQAVKAMSGVGVRLARAVLFEAVPAMRAQPASVNSGDSPVLIVSASRADERYTVQIAGAIVSGPHTGNGSDLTLALGPLTRTTTFTILVDRDDVTHLPCQRSRQVTVEVR